MANFGVLNWAIVILYLVANLLLGYMMSRKVKTAADFQLGTKTLPWWAIGISVVATYVSALSFLGGPAWAYGDGMAALAIHINYPLVIFVVIVLFLPFFFNSGVASIYEYLERRFGPTSRSVMAILFLVTQVITTASILTATAVVITFVTGIDVGLAIIGMTFVVLIYTLMGGMNAVIWTDVLQGVILFLGAGIVLWGLLNAVTPLSGALDYLATDGKLNPINTDLDFSVAPTVWAGVFAMTLFHITVYGSNQMMVQRTLAAKNIGDAKKSYLLMGFGAFFIYFLFFFIGALLYVHFKGEPFEQPNEIILVFAESLSVPGLMGIIAAAVLSASMSSLSSALNSLATVSTTDFYQRFFRKNESDTHYLWSTRIFTLVWAVLAIPVAFAFVRSGGSILETLSAVGAYLVGAKLAMFGLGFLSKHTSERGLLIGVVAGFIALFYLAGFAPLGVEPLMDVAWPWYAVIGGAVNIIVSWGASVLLDGFQSDWHEQTVPGQMRFFRETGRPETDGGWYLVPGRVDRISWLLPVFFVGILGFLVWFGTLGSAG
ncbi:MAG: sodium/solute symporter [Pseudomonadota bacterium]